jgi:hypothetical protein
MVLTKMVVEMEILLVMRRSKCDGGGEREVCMRLMASDVVHLCTTAVRSASPSLPCCAVL